MRDLAFNVKFNNIDTSPIKNADKAMDGVKDSMGGVVTQSDKVGKGIASSMNTSPVEKMKKSMADIGKSMEKTGKKLMKGVTLPLAGVGAGAVATVAKFDDAMANIKKTSGATGEEFDALRDKAKELGRSTAFSASEAADGMGVLAAAGLKTNEILKVSEDMFNLMSAGSIDADTSARVLANTMTQFNLTADDSGRIVDAFAATASNAQINVEQLEHAMNQAGGSLAGMNMTLEESTAVFGHLISGAIPVGEVGTVVKAMTRDLTANADKFKKLGVDVYDPVTEQLNDMGNIMEQLESATAGMTDEQRNAALATGLSGQALQGTNAFLNEGTEAYRALTNEIIKAENAAETMAAIQEDTVGGAFRAVSSAIEGMLIEIGDVIKKPVQEIALGIQRLAGVFGELPDGTKKAIVAIAGIAVAIGPAIFIVGKLAGAFGLVMSPIGILGVAIAGLAGTLGYLWKTNEDFRDKLIGAWDSIRSKVGESIESMQAFWSEHGEAIKGKLSEVFTAIGERVMSGIEWFQEFWATHGESIVETVSSLFTTIWTVVSGAFELIKEVVSIALNWISEFWSNHGETIMGITSAMWGIISGVIQGATTVIQGVISAVLGIITGDWERAWTGVQSIFEGVMDAISAAWNFVKDLLGKAIKGTVDAVTDKFHSAMDKVKEKWEGLKTFMKNPIKGTVGLVQKGAGWVSDKLGFPHKDGAYNIPYDNYPANLHKNEMVLTAAASNQFRAMGGTEDSVPNIQNISNSSVDKSNIIRETVNNRPENKVTNVDNKVNNINNVLEQITNRVNNIIDRSKSIKNVANESNNFESKVSNRIDEGDRVNNKSILDQLINNVSNVFNNKDISNDSTNRYMEDNENNYNNSTTVIKRGADKEVATMPAITFSPVYNIELSGTANEGDKRELGEVIDKKTRELFNKFFKEMSMKMS